MPQNIKTSGFSLAKRNELTGDDFYNTSRVGNLTITIVCEGAFIIMSIINFGLLIYINS
jgi:hypothetical protein